MVSTIGVVQRITRRKKGSQSSSSKKERSLRNLISLISMISMISLRREILREKEEIMRQRRIKKRKRMKIN